MSKKIAKVSILRGAETHGNGTWVDYEVPLEEGMTVLGVLDYIYENIDSSLAYYQSCRYGRCKGCHVAINGGKPVLACTEIATGEMKISPVEGFKLIRDLVIDYNTTIKK